MARTGRPKIETNANQRMAVAVMSAVGTPYEMMLDELVRMRLTSTRLSIKTFRKAFAFELENGGKIATARMGSSLWTKGIGNGPGAIQAATFWLATKGARMDKDWQKIDGLEITDKLTREIAEGIELGIFTDAELAELAAGRISRNLFDRLANAPRRPASPGAGGTETPGAAAPAAAKPAA